MSSNEQKAQQLLAEAEKKLSVKGFFSSLFGYVIFLRLIIVHIQTNLFSDLCCSRGGSAKVEDAIECYQRAANLLKMAKKWNEAGAAFCDAANLHLRTGSRHEASVNFVDAANCYKKTDVQGMNLVLFKVFEFSLINYVKYIYITVAFYI